MLCACLLLPKAIASLAWTGGGAQVYIVLGDFSWLWVALNLSPQSNDYRTLAAALQKGLGSHHPINWILEHRQPGCSTSHSSTPSTHKQVSPDNSSNCHSSDDPKTLQGGLGLAAGPGEVRDLGASNRNSRAYAKSYGLHTSQPPSPELL